MTPSYRGRRLLAVLAVLSTVAFAVPRFLTHNPYQRLGVTLNWVRGQEFPQVARVIGPPAEYLLEKGDELRGIDGVLFSGSRDMLEYLKRNGWPKGPFTLTIDRTSRTFNIVVPPVQLGAWQRLRLFFFNVAAMIAAPLVAFLLVWRRPDLGAAWVFLWFAALQGLGGIWETYQYPALAPSGSLKTYLDVYRALLLWFPASFLHFMTVFPRPRWQPGRRWQSWWFRLVVAANLVPVVMIVVGLARHSTMDTPYVWFQSIALPLGVLSLVGSYARPGEGRRPSASERVLALVVAGVLILATVLGAIAEEPRIIALYSLPLVRIAITTVFVAWLAAPVLIAWLIANDPMFDPRRLLVRSLPYALLSGILAAVYLGFALAGERLFAAATGEQAMLFNVVAALVVAFAFAPLRERVQRWIDRLYGRDPHALRLALDLAGRELLGALDPGEVKRSVEQGLERGLRRPVAIEWPPHGIPRVADGEELPDHAKSAVDALLVQAGIRLENLALQQERAAHERREVELREAAIRAELRALQAQVQPHFLFNALNALAYLIETDAAAAQRFTERLADMLRYTVEAGSRPAALLSDEIAFVEDYLGVARERYENPMAFEYRGARDLLSLAVPPLLLQPLVENSLKHGCAPGARPLHLALEARAEGGWLDLMFTDDGAKNGTSAIGLGVGLENLEQRLRRFGGSDATVVAGPRASGGFEVRMRWRLRERMAA
jgi:histidine kinase